MASPAPPPRSRLDAARRGVLRQRLWEERPRGRGHTSVANPKGRDREERVGGWRVSAQRRCAFAARRRGPRARDGLRGRVGGRGSDRAGGHIHPPADGGSRVSNARRCPRAPPRRAAPWVGAPTCHPAPRRACPCRGWPTSSGVPGGRQSGHDRRHERSRQTARARASQVGGVEPERPRQTHHRMAEEEIRMRMTEKKKINTMP